jgi:hypothetical protein
VPGAPKNPADRNRRLRELADGEDCTVRLPGGACDPATVVWAHTNSLSDQKGRGYKGHDSQGFFACYRCHSALDQPGAGGLTQPQREAAIARAQGVTSRRLEQISASTTMRPWKIDAARWALDRREP